MFYCITMWWWHGWTAERSYLQKQGCPRVTQEVRRISAFKQRGAVKLSYLLGGAGKVHVWAHQDQVGSNSWTNTTLNRWTKLLTIKLLGDTSPRVNTLSRQIPLQECPRTSMNLKLDQKACKLSNPDLPLRTCVLMSQRSYCFKPDWWGHRSYPKVSNSSPVSSADVSL